MWIGRGNRRRKERAQERERAKLKDDPKAFYEAMLQNSNWEKKLLAAEKLIEIDAEHLEAQWMKGYILFKHQDQATGLTQMEYAIDLVEKCLIRSENEIYIDGSLRDTLTRYCDFLGEIYRQDQHLEAAAICYLKIIYQADSRVEKGWTGLGNIYLLRNLPQKAIACYLESYNLIDNWLIGNLEYGRDEDWRFRWEFNPDRKGNLLARVISTYSRVIELYFDRRNLIFNIGLAHYRQDDLAGALSWLEKNIEPEKTYLKICRRLIKRCKRNRDKKLAATYRKKLEFLSAGDRMSQALYAKIKGLQNQSTNER